MIVYGDGLDELVLYGEFIIFDFEYGDICKFIVIVEDFGLLFFFFVVIEGGELEENRKYIEVVFVGEGEEVYCVVIVMNCGVLFKVMGYVNMFKDGVEMVMEVMYVGCLLNVLF